MVAVTVTDVVAVAALVLSLWEFPPLQRRLEDRRVARENAWSEYQAGCELGYIADPPPPRRWWQ